MTIAASSEVRTTVPVSDISPPSGPSCPNPLNESTTSRGLMSASRLTGNPSRSSTPGRKSSMDTSALAASAASVALSASALSSSRMDSLLRFAER